MDIGEDGRMERMEDWRGREDGDKLKV